VYYVGYMAGGRFHHNNKAVLLHERSLDVSVSVYRQRMGKPHLYWTSDLLLAICYVREQLSFPVVGWLQIPESLIQADDGASTLNERVHGMVRALVIYQRTTGELGAAKVYQSIVGCTEAQSKATIHDLMSLFTDQFPPSARRLLAESDATALLQYDDSARIAAIQRYRTYTGLPLNVCRDAIDALRVQMGQATPRLESRTAS
jgi:hypothetical protein